MSKLSIVAAIGVLIGMTACSDMPVSPSEDGAGLSPLNEAASYSKQGKTFVVIPFGPFNMSFVNPCTGFDDVLTRVGTLWVYDKGDGRFVVRSKSVATTQSGFEGSQSRTFLNNGNIFKVSVSAMLTNAIGQRLKVHFVHVIDESSGTDRVRTEGGPVCVRQ